MAWSACGTCSTADQALSQLAALAAEHPAVVLDDDPTGTQTLRDVTVLTQWNAASIARHLGDPVLFLSTNSRSVETTEAVAIARSAVSDALAAARDRGRPVSLVSRSDSTLRGHFPAETMAMAAAADMPDARVLLAPFFADGGRMTADDVHYLERDGKRTPVAETEFSADVLFGYRSSNLRQWVAEKYVASGLAPPPVVSVTLADVRDGGPDAVFARLSAAPPGAVVIANAETNSDIERIALGALRAEQAGLPLVARVAASYVRARAGAAPAPLLGKGELGVSGPGIVIVGSHVEATSRQLDDLRDRFAPRLDVRELKVVDLLGPLQSLVSDAARHADESLASGRIPVVVTQRERIDTRVDEGRQVSRALAAIVSALKTRPDWVLAKGGITSSDVAVHGMNMIEARVRGQILPGVPVWIGTDDARWPGVPLVVFPGNVGGTDGLTRAVERMSAGR